MTEQLRPNDFENLNAQINELAAKYAVIEEENEIRRNGDRLLGELGVSTEARTIVNACSVLMDIAYRQLPSDSIRLEDVIPTVSAVISQTKRHAQEQGIDLRTELTTAFNYLTSIKNSDLDIEYTPERGGLSLDFKDSTLNPLIANIENSLRVV